MKNLTKYNIVYDKPILQWDEALPLGNGKIGCLIYGDGPLHLTLDQVNVELRFPRKMQLRIKNTFGTSTVNLLQNGTAQTLTEENGYFLVEGKRGKVKLKI